MLAFIMMMIMPATAVQAQAPSPRQGVVRVKLQPEVSKRIGHQAKIAPKGTTLVTGIQGLDASAKKLKASGMQRVFPYSEKFEKQRAAYGLDRWYEITFDESVSPVEARKIMAETPGVQRADYVVPMVLKEGDGKFVVAKDPVKTPSSAMPFNDPRLPAQWHYHNDGSIAESLAGADINLFEAWKKETGKSNVIVAVIDGGIDVNHEDLAANIFINEAELNGLPGFDDDGNGYIDDVYGYNFVTNSPELYPHSHGTHVAGTVAAVNNNGLGVAGVAGGDGTPGSGVKMISCQVFDSRSGTGDGDFAKALVYAAERGASIAQCSWGWASSDYYEQDVLDAIDYFTETSRSDVLTGGLCIFAAGNDGLEGNFYPSCYPKVLAVVAMGADGKVAPYSNYGTWADIVAPGGNMDYNTALGVLSTLPSNEYGYNEGTSMATPHVTGIAALVLSSYGKPDLLNETLRQQIVTSVNDFYALNPEARGYFGSGSVDAAKALMMGTGEAPEAVADFTLAPSQEEILISWVIPSSSDNNVNHHTIYYSTEPFTAASDLTKLKSVVADTKFNSSGDSYQYELTGLNAMTTYYIALTAVDRWGNASALSEVKSATTNAGPEMTVDAGWDGLYLAIDQVSQPVASAEFTIGNAAEGLLKWSTYKRTMPVSMWGINRPNPGKVATFSGKAGVQRVAQHSVIDMEEYDPSAFPTNFSYYTTIYAYIGESNPKLSNSLAQMFTVDAATYPEGFNLTHVSLLGNNGADPTIQVYRGTSISTATLELEMQPTYWSYASQTRLSEQLWFAPGESFWIVYHFDPSETLYPLGIGSAVEGYNENYSYMSTDMGKTWSRLSDVLRGTAYSSTTVAFAVTAISQNPDWSSVLVLNPSEGTIPAGGTQLVTVSNDGQKLINGSYRAKIGFTTNETTKNQQSVQVNIDATGGTPDITGPKVVNFGDLIVGQTKTLGVRVFNKGYGTFTSSTYSDAIFSSSVSSSSEHFTGPDYVSGGFPARNYQTVNVTFAPQSAGSHVGVITFTDINGATYKLTVQGVASDPAKIEIEPATIDAGELSAGAEPITREFTISNTGKYPLEFALPKFSTETIEGATGGSHRYGYTYQSNLNGSDGFEYDGNPVLYNATDITSQFTDDNYISREIDLGFDFPYYGKSYSKVYVTSFGGVMFGLPESPFRSPLTETSYGVPGTGLISAFGTQLPMAANSRVEYARQDGKFVVKFTDVMGLVYDTDYTPISFHMTLSSNGDVEIFYDNYDPWSLFQSGSTLFVGLNDMECADPLVVTSSEQYWDNNITISQDFMTGTAVKFVAPKPYFVTDITPADGLIVPGESMTLTATLLATADMNAGATYNNIAISSNDPLSPVSFVRFDAVITGDDLVPVATVESENCDFGEVFRTADAVRTVPLKNSGRDVMTVNSITVSGNGFTTDLATPLTIEPGMAKDIPVTLATEVSGSYTGKLTIATDGGELEVNLHGTVIGAPAISLSYESITETVESGATLSRPLTVANTGDEPMTFAVVPNPMVEFPAETGEGTATAYSYSASVDDSSVKMEWIDIENSDLTTHRDYLYFLEHDFVEVELPFEFPFYGKNYSKMYIYNTGFVSFSYVADQKIWPEPPAEFPAGSIYSNLIAPYWGMHSMDGNTTAGVYYQISENQAVISFMEYGNSMNSGICFQLILKNDGTFKFQYKAKDENSIIYSLFGVSGIANEGGTEGIKLPERAIRFGGAITFAPVVTNTLAPGQEKVVDITVPVTQMAGEYSSDLIIDTNVPHNEKITVPVNLTVTGVAEPVFPGDIHVTRPVGYVGTPDEGPITAMGAPYEAYIKIENNGTAPFTIVGVEYESPMIFDDWFGYEYPAFELWVNGEEYDWMTGEPTGNKQWQQYMYMPVVVGKDGAEFSFPNMNMLYEPGEWTIPVTFHCEGLEQESYSMNVIFTVTPAPMMDIDRYDITVEGALPGEVYTEKVTVSNWGEYPLNFNLTLDPTGKGDESADDNGGGIDPWFKTASKEIAKSAPSTLETLTSVKPFATGASSMVYDTPTEPEFTNALYHAVSQPSPTSYMMGSMNRFDDFIASTAYVSPEGGVNITDIYTAYYYPGVADVELTVDIVKGSSPLGSTLLGHGSLQADESTSTSGRFTLIPLDRETYIPEGEEFCVVITYPAGVETPTYLVQKADDVVESRYMAYYDSYSWFDLGETFRDTYGSLGFIATCIERHEGEFWAKVLGDFAGATVESGQTAEFEVQLTTDRAPLDADNKAMLVITSDDPNVKVMNFPIVLNKNLAPQITAAEAVVYVQENSSTETAITVTEPEDEAFTITIEDNGSLARIASATGDATIDGKTVTVAAGNGATTLKVALEAAYGDAGSFWFTVTATDANGVKADSRVRYVVEHVNRAPVLNADAATITVVKGATSDVINIADYFTDPDGDAMTFEVETADAAIAQCFNSGSSSIFYGVATGKTVAKVVATDENGASVMAEISVEVTEPSGIELVAADSAIGIYPNPVVETLNVTTDFSADGAKISLYTTAGSMAFTTEADLTAGVPTQINVAHLAAGYYVLIIETDTTIKSASVIKR